MAAIDYQHYARYERPDVLLFDQRCQAGVASLNGEFRKDRRAFCGWVLMYEKR